MAQPFIYLLTGTLTTLRANDGVDVKRLGQYDLIDTIGEGGMGRVYRAYDTQQRRTVALKVMSPKAIGNPELARYFQREADMVRPLTSPNIIPIHQAGVIDGTPYLDMRFVDGHTLGSVVRNYGPALLSSALRIVEQTAAALDDAHRSGVVHRDVKPANLLIDKTGHVYLADFGIAVAAAHRGDGEKISGTFQYMAPERFTGGEVTGSCDTYALACVLHYALTGQPPYVGETMQQLCDAHTYAPIPSLVGRVPGITPEIDEIIKWALAKHPGDRPRTTGQWAKALRAAVNNAEAARGYRTPAPADLAQQPFVAPTRPAPSPPKDHKTAWQIALLVMLLALAGVLVAMILTGQ